MRWWLLSAIAVITFFGGFVVASHCSSLWSSRAPIWVWVISVGAATLVLGALIAATHVHRLPRPWPHLTFCALFLCSLVLGFAFCFIAASALGLLPESEPDPTPAWAHWFMVSIVALFLLTWIGATRHVDRQWCAASADAMPTPGENK